MTTVTLTNNELNGHHDHGDQSQPRMETEHVRDWRRCQVVGLPNCPEKRKLRKSELPLDGPLINKKGIHKAQKC